MRCLDGKPVFDEDEPPTATAEIYDPRTGVWTLTGSMHQDRADHSAVQCSWASGPGNAATIRIKIDRARLSGERLQTTIGITLSKPISQTITIPVTLTPDS